MESIKQQTGGDRPFPNAICQDEAVLLAIKIFTYDLNDESFVQYYIDRYGVVITSSLSWRKTFAIENHPKEEYQQMIKGQLQDCWELYLKNEKGGAICV